MGKFKVGDAVRLKKDFYLHSCGSFFRKGSTHTVVSVCSGLLGLRDTLGIIWTFLDEDAECVLNSKTPDPKTASSTKFKVGDKVEVIGKDPASAIEIGTKGEIVKFDRNYTGRDIVIEFDDGSGQGSFHFYELRLLNSKTSDPKTDNASDHLELDPYKKLAQDILYRYSSNCSHSWKQYLGFNDSFEYCEHCDARKDEI